MGRGSATGGGMRPVSALYVDVERGPYARMPDVDAWGIERDARTYAGPHPVVAHPPCERWGNLFAFDGPTYSGKLGDDDGCFAAAVASVRRFGGVIEHPAGSRAWQAFSLPPPGAWGVWRGADSLGYSVRVEQGHFGFPAPKATLLWAFRVPRSKLPTRQGGRSGAPKRVEFMAREARHITPPAFAELLVSIARGAA